MTNQASQVVVGASGKVWVAATTDTAPSNSATALAAAWVDLGYVSEDGATFTEGKDIVDIGAWQSFFPVRKIISARSVAVSFALRQWSRPTVEFALGGTVAVNSAEWKYTPPSPSTMDVRSLVLEWTDGSKHYRLYIPTGLVTEAVETNFTRTSASDLPITFMATDPGAGKTIYTLFTDDAAFAATS